VFNNSIYFCLFIEILIVNLNVLDTSCDLSSEIHTEVSDTSLDRSFACDFCCTMNPNLFLSKSVHREVDHLKYTDNHLTKLSAVRFWSKINASFVLTGGLKSGSNGNCWSGVNGVSQPRASTALAISTGVKSAPANGMESS